MLCPTLRVTFLRGPLALCVNNSVKECVSADADSKTYDLNRFQPYGDERFVSSQHFLLFVSKLFTLQRAKALSKCSNLVDPASSHMLVSKINPCMCKYKYCTAKLRMAH